MGGYRRTYGTERGELLTSGDGGETAHLEISISPLHSPGFWDSIHKDESSGRRKRTKPQGVLLHGGTAALGKVNLPQTVCANCETVYSAEFRACHKCGWQTRAPSEQQIIEACAKARAG